MRVVVEQSAVFDRCDAGAARALRALGAAARREAATAFTRGVDGRADLFLGPLGF